MFFVALDPLYWAMCAVSYLLSATSIETAGKYGAFFIFFFACDPVISRGDAVQILTQ